MTTPRDDIAGLSERLRADVGQRDIYRTDATLLEAATQLDSLQARVKELEENITEIPQLLRRAESRATRLQQEREIAQFGFEHELQIKKELADALRKAQQERDEAYERAAKVAESPDIWKQYDGDFEGNCIAAAIRRLAGPEKEGK